MNVLLTYVMKGISFVLFASCLVGLAGHAQEKRLLTLGEFLKNVGRANIAYAAERYNVEIAEANLSAAGVFPDPELSVSYANHQDWALRMGYGVEAELSYTLELGGKRKARMRLAQKQKGLTMALLDDYFRKLRADAALVFFRALRQRRLCEILSASHAQMLALAQADSLRLRLGVVTEVDARQSRLEAAAMLNEVYAAEGDLHVVWLELAWLQGDRLMGGLDSLAGTLDAFGREFDLPSLVVTAQNNRADLQAALWAKDVSQQSLRLAEANRVIDLGVSLGGGYSSEVLNVIAPAPAFVGVTAGVSIPLRLSNANRGGVRAARLVAMQSDRLYEGVELQICSDVLRANSAYATACRRVEQFGAGLLADAQMILQSKVYSYGRGETGLLEVLNAQRTYNDVQRSYNETLYERAVALVELERACGIWDIGVED
jgi:cobalt-zinc-cadmium efflux system outer membrane protein